MMKVRTTKQVVKGTCGHRIRAGEELLVVRSRPHYRCRACATKMVAMRLHELAHDSIQTARDAIAEAEKGER